MVVRMRATRGHTGNRRSHHALSGPRLSKCVSCGALHVRHHVCQTCGKYQGRVVIDLAGEAQKKAAKQKAKENAVK